MNIRTNYKLMGFIVAGAVAIAIGISFRLMNGSIGRDTVNENLTAFFPEKDALRDAQTKDFAALEKEVAQLRAEIKTLKQQSDPLPQSLSTETFQTKVAKRNEAETGSAERDVVSNIAIAQRQHQKRMDAIEQNFLQQKTDMGWANAASTLIQQVLDTPGKANESEFADTAIRSIECRSTLCKIEVTHSNMSSMRRFIDDFPSSLGNELPRMAFQQHQNPDGSIDMYVYIAKKGNSFTAD